MKTSDQCGGAISRSNDSYGPSNSTLYCGCAGVSEQTRMFPYQSSTGSIPSVSKISRENTQHVERIKRLCLSVADAIGRNIHVVSLMSNKSRTC